MCPEKLQSLVPFAEHTLRRHGFAVTSEKSEAAESSPLPLVVGPAALKNPPEGYLAFQLEPLLVSPLLSFSYLNKLLLASSIWDYSLTNTQILSALGFDPLKIEHVNICPLDGDGGGGNHLVSFAEREIDVLFFGWAKSDRRQAALAHLSQNLNLVVVENLFSPEVDSLISKTKVVVNIHFYEGSDLEQVRIAQCFAEGTPVISENSEDALNWPHYQAVRFVDSADWEGMVRIAQQLVTSEQLWTEQSLASLSSCAKCAHN